MKTLRELLKPPHVTGRIEAIVVRGESRQPARCIESTQALPGLGLADDRLGRRSTAKPSTREVTLIQHEHLPVIAALAGVTVVDPIALRRNLVVSGINLLALKNARIRVGHALLEIVAPCHPVFTHGRRRGPWGLCGDAGSWGDDGAGDRGRGDQRGGWGAGGGGVRQVARWVMAHHFARQ